MTHDKKYGLLSSMAILAAFGVDAIFDKSCGSTSHAKLPPEKPCRRCGKMKRHNNHFCSAECCKLWKRGDRNEVV